MYYGWSLFIAQRSLSDHFTRPQFPTDYHFHLDDGQLTHTIIVDLKIICKKHRLNCFYDSSTGYIRIENTILFYLPASTCGIRLSCMSFLHDFIFNPVTSRGKLATRIPPNPQIIFLVGRYDSHIICISFPYLSSPQLQDFPTRIDVQHWTERILGEDRAPIIFYRTKNIIIELT